MVYESTVGGAGSLNPKNLIVIFAVASTVIACSAERHPESHEPEVVSFEFRKLVPESTTVDAAEKTGTVRDCDTDGHGSFGCRLTKAAVGNLPINDLKSEVGFANGRFAWFSFPFDTGDYDQMRKQMTSFYGAPCVDEKKAIGEVWSKCLPKRRTMVLQGRAIDVDRGILVASRYRQRRP